MNRHYTDDEIKRAKNIDMVAFLTVHRGLDFRQRGGEYIALEHPSLSVNIDCKRWYWHSQDCGGANAIDFLRGIEGKTFQEAMEILLSRYAGYTVDYTVCTERPKEEERCCFLSQPDKSSSFIRLYAYLTQTRKIDREIVQSLVDDQKIYQDTNGNVVFCGYDENGVIRYATLRGTLSNSAKPFRHDASGSDKRYGFRFGDDSGDTVFVFEAAIDAMSHATIALYNGGRWWEQSRLALGGVADVALDEYLRTHPQAKMIVLCLDNDDKGNDVSERMQQKYCELGYTVERETPRMKDFNEDLCNFG